MAKRTDSERALVPISSEQTSRQLSTALSDLQTEQLAELFSKHALAANTRRAYEQGWRDFIEFCRMHRFKPYPAQQTVIAAYLNWLSGEIDPKTGGQRSEGLKFATISLRQHAIAYIHDMKNLGIEGYLNPARSKLVTTTVAAIRRKLEDLAATVRASSPASRTSVRHERDLLSTQVRALTLPDMESLMSALPVSLSGTRDRALLLIGYAGAFRRSELVAITYRDLTFYEDSIDIRVQRSKTDQKGAGEDKLIARLPSELVHLCPVAALEAWIDVLRAKKIYNGSIFRRVFKEKSIGKSGLSAKAVETIIRRAVKNSDLPHPAAAYAGHSLRAGFVTQALENGADPLSIIEVTKHKDLQMIQRYARPTAQRRKASALSGFVKPPAP